MSILNKGLIISPYRAGEIRVIDGNQYDLPVFNKGWSGKQLLLLGRGLKSYVFFSLMDTLGETRFYIEEMDEVGKLHKIQDDDLWNELLAFTDTYHNRIKPEGSDVYPGTR